MATTKEVVKSRLLEFGASISEITLDSYITKSKINGSANFTSENAVDADRAMYEIIPMLLLLPKISEGQFSREYVVAGITGYYQILCDALGLENKLNPQPKIIDKSDIW